MTEGAHAAEYVRVIEHALSDKMPDDWRYDLQEVAKYVVSELVYAGLLIDGPGTA